MKCAWFRHGLEVRCKSRPGQAPGGDKAKGMGKGEGVPAACPERSHVVELAAADAQEDGVLNAAPGGVPAHGEGGDDAVLRRGR